MKNDLAKELYKFYRSGFRKLRAGGQVSIERTKNTDPQSLESVLSEVIAGRNWGKGFAEGNLFSNWEEIVGVEIAQSAEQTLITVAVENDLPKSITGSRYLVKSGVVSKL